MTALLAATWPKIQHEGIGSIAPVSVLLFVVQMSGSEWAMDGVEYHIRDDLSHFQRHTTGDSLWRWQWRWFGRILLDRMTGEPIVWYDRHRYMRYLSSIHEFSGDPVLREKIMEVLTRDLESANGQIRTAAVRYSIDLSDTESSLDRVIRFLDDDDAQVSEAAYHALGIIARYRMAAFELLLESLDHEDATVRASAVRAIFHAVIEQGDASHLPGAVEALHAMKNDVSGAVRERRVHTLARLLGNVEGWAMAMAVWQGDEPYAQAGVLYAVVHLLPQRKESAEMVIEALERLHAMDDPRRGVVISSLARYLEPDVLREQVSRLETQRRHEDLEVRSAILSALERIK